MKALVLCGGMSQLALLKELKRRNIFSVLVDMNEKAPAVAYADRFYKISAMDYEGVLGVCKKEKVDFVISVCADQMLLVAAKISEELGLPSYIDYKTAKLVSNKEKMKKIFVDNMIPTSKYFVRRVFNKEDLREMRFPLVIKPVDAYSSRGVTKVVNLEEAKLAFNKAVNISRTKTAIIEEYAEGTELSVDCYVEDGISKLQCIRALDKIPQGEGFIICRGKYPVKLSDDTLNELRIVSQRIASAFGLLNTPMLIQLKLNGNEIKVIEFCSRTGGGIKYRLLPRISGFDVVTAVLDLTLGNKPHYDGYQLDKYIIDEFVYCKSGIFDHLEGFDKLIKNGIIEDFEQFKASGYEFKDIQSSSDRLAYFSVEGDSEAEVLEKHRQANLTIRAMSSNGEDLIRHDIIESLYL